MEKVFSGFTPTPTGLLPVSIQEVGSLPKLLIMMAYNYSSNNYISGIGGFPSAMDAAYGEVDWKNWTEKRSVS